MLVALDARDLHQTPDSYGLIYFHGQPITGVPIDAKYSTPFAHADQQFLRPTLSDQWFGSDMLTITHQQVHIFTIAGGQITRHRAVRDDLGLLLQLGWRPRTG